MFWNPFQFELNFGNLWGVEKISTLLCRQRLHCIPGLSKCTCCFLITIEGSRLTSFSERVAPTSIPEQKKLQKGCHEGPYPSLKTSKLEGWKIFLSHLPKLPIQVFEIQNFGDKC